MRTFNVPHHNNLNLTLAFLLKIIQKVCFSAGETEVLQ